MAGTDTSPWLADLAAAVRGENYPRALTILESRSTSPAGTPSAADKHAAARTIEQASAGQVESLLRWVRWLAEQPVPTAKELTAILARRTYPHHPHEALAWLRRFSDDANWEVREWAAFTLGELLDRRFAEIYPALADWTSHPSQFVRRAALVAARKAAKARHPERCQPLLALIEPLVGDRAEEVRRNLGPFAVGDGLLKAYPDATLDRVRQWVRSDDEMARWNAAMVFVTAAARRHSDAGLDILSDLARDQRRMVAYAVAAALRNLAKADRARVLPILRTWLRDERKLPAALAMRHRDMR